MINNYFDRLMNGGRSRSPAIALAVALAIAFAASAIASELLTGSEPAVAIDDGGNAVVVFEAGEGVFARLFDASGMPLGSSFRIDAAADAEARVPDVAYLADGTFVVVWEGIDGGDSGDSDDSDDSDGDAVQVQLVARRFDPFGMPLGSELRLEASGDGDDRAPDVAGDPDGGFVVVWEREDAGGGSTVCVRRLDPP